jgi:hypothetical protein
MSISNDPPAGQRSLQFGIRSLLWLTAVVALLLICLLMSQRLRRAEQALARTAWATSDVSIPPGKFRLLADTIVDDSDLKVLVVRFEAGRECYVSVDGQSSITTQMPDNDTHYAEITIVGNYDQTPGRFTLLTRVGSGGGYAGGKSIRTLRPATAPADLLNITVQPGLYDLSQPVEIYRDEGKPVMLTVK